MSSKQMRYDLDHLTGVVDIMERRIDALSEFAHASHSVPSEGLVLEWVARDRDKRRRSRLERAIVSSIILLLVGSLLWSIGSAITWVAS